MDENENVNPFAPDNDFFGSVFKDYKPEAQTDDNEFKPIKGKYLCRITKLAHVIGVSQTTSEPYNFYSLDLQVTTTLDGDKGDRRYLRKRYQNDEKGLKNLANDLFTAGVEFDKSSQEAFDLSLSTAVDKLVNVRAWVWIPENDRSGNVIPESERIARQQFKIVKEFKDKKSTSSDSANVPF